MSLIEHIGFGRKSQTEPAAPAAPTEVASEMAPAAPAPESVALFEPENKPEYAQTCEDLRGALLDTSDQPGAGLAELQKIVDLAKTGQIPTESLLEAMGIAYTLDERFSHRADLMIAPQQRIEADKPYPPAKAPNRVYEEALARLNHAVYGGTEAVVPDIVQRPLTSEPQAIPWTGFPVQVMRDDQSVLTLSLGPERTDYVWHGSTPGGEQATISQEDTRQLAGITLHSVPPHLEAQDPAGMTYFQTFRFPHPQEVAESKQKIAQSKQLDQARQAVEQADT